MAFVDEVPLHWQMAEDSRPIRLFGSFAEVNVRTLQELFQFTRSNARKKDKNRYSQKLGVSFLCCVVEEANRAFPFRAIH